jgi:hypothetical protein
VEIKMAIIPEQMASMNKEISDVDPSELGNGWRLFKE